MPFNSRYLLHSAGIVFGRSLPNNGKKTSMESRKSKDESRRVFFVQTCQAGASVVLGLGLVQLLEACGVNDPDILNVADIPILNVPSSNAVVTLTIDSNSPLFGIGTAALVRYGSGSLLTAHTVEDTFIAVTAICTHESCEITGYANQTYICRCHGSQFNTSGHVVQGPAGRALRTFATQFTNPQLTITLA